MEDIGPRTDVGHSNGGAASHAWLKAMLGKVWKEITPPTTGVRGVTRENFEIANAKSCIFSNQEIKTTGMTRIGIR